VRSPPVLRLLAMSMGRVVSTVAWPGERLVHEGPARGVPAFDAAACNRCGDCVSVCPSASIAMEEDAGAPHVDAGTCVRCGLCVDTCRPGAITLGGPRELAALSRDDLVLDGSPPAEVPVGPAPSSLYRLSVAENGVRWRSPEALLEDRVRGLSRREGDGRGGG